MLETTDPNYILCICNMIIHFFISGSDYRYGLSTSIGRRNGGVHFSFNHGTQQHFQKVNHPHSSGKISELVQPSGTTQIQAQSRVGYNNLKTTQIYSSINNRSGVSGTTSGTNYFRQSYLSLYNQIT